MSCTIAFGRLGALVSYPSTFSLRRVKGINLLKTLDKFEEALIRFFLFDVWLVSYAFVI